MIKDSITSKRGRVFYWIERNTSDKCIVFIHGLTADHTLFDKQIDFWSRGYTVITFDMPLHGESRPYNDFTFYNVADDLKSILMKEKITHIVIAGQSAGGYVAQAFTQKYAKYVDAFIGIDTTPFGKSYYKWFEIADTNFAKKLNQYYLTCTIYRTPIYPQSLRQWLVSIEEKHGFKHISCHGLRHTYCSILLSQNVPIQTVSRYMGHSDSTVTLHVYSHLIPDTQEKALNALNNLF